MLDDVSSAPNAHLLRQLRRAIMLARSCAVEDGEICIVTAPYRYLLTKLPAPDQLEHKLGEAVLALPTVATVLAKLRTQDPAIMDELIGLFDDLGYGSIYQRIMAPLVDASASDDPEILRAGLQELTRWAAALGFSIGFNASKSPLEPVTAIPDLQRHTVDMVQVDEGDLVDELGLSPADRRRWSQALRELAVRQGYQLEASEVAPALDFLVGRLNELETADGIHPGDSWPDADHLDGADQAQITIPVDVLGGLVASATYHALLSLPTSPPATAERGSDEHVAAITRVVMREVERIVMERRVLHTRASAAMDTTERETDGAALARMGVDGAAWAAEFMRLFGHRRDEIDEGLMIGWFANAIEAGKVRAGS